MRQGGIVAVGDICNASLTGESSKGSRESSLPRFRGGYHGFDRGWRAIALSTCLGAGQLADHPGVGAETISIVPHSPIPFPTNSGIQIVGLLGIASVYAQPGNTGGKKRTLPCRNRRMVEAVRTIIDRYFPGSNPRASRARRKVLPRFKPSQSVIPGS